MHKSRYSFVNSFLMNSMTIVIIYVPHFSTLICFFKCFLVSLNLFQAVLFLSLFFFLSLSSLYSGQIRRKCNYLCTFYSHTLQIASSYKSPRQTFVASSTNFLPLSLDIMHLPNMSLIIMYFLFSL